MARAPVVAAGGIVLRQGATPLLAVVCQRKRSEWVLPKGKLDSGETAKQAAKREVLEETGHNVAVHEFLGTLAYQSGGRTKVVHFWRMEANFRPVAKLMSDITAVEWLPLDVAIARLSREYERAFLTHVGPIAVEAATRARAERRNRPRPPARRVVREETVETDAAPANQPLPAEMATTDEYRATGVTFAEAVEIASEPAMIDDEAPLDSTSEAPLPEPDESEPLKKGLIDKMKSWLRGDA
jgi:8-oxo-dGTP diphosphatase